MSGVVSALDITRITQLVDFRGVIDQSVDLLTIVEVRSYTADVIKGFRNLKSSCPLLFPRKFISATNQRISLCQVREADCYQGLCIKWQYMVP